MARKTYSIKVECDSAEEYERVLSLLLKDAAVDSASEQPETKTIFVVMKPITGEL